MVVDRFKIFRFHRESHDARVLLQFERDVAHQIFNKFRVVVGALGDELFVAALEQAIQFARGGALGDISQVADRHRLGNQHLDRDV